jgi:ferredoxin
VADEGEEEKAVEDLSMGLGLPAETKESKEAKEKEAKEKEEKQKGWIFVVWLCCAVLCCWRRREGGHEEARFGLCVATCPVDLTTLMSALLAILLAPVVCGESLFCS